MIAEITNSHADTNYTRITIAAGGKICKVDHILYVQLIHMISFTLYSRQLIYRCSKAWLELKKFKYFSSSREEVG